MATPVAARGWAGSACASTLGKPVRYLVLSHYHAVAGWLGASAFDADMIVAHDKHQGADRRARPGGLGQRVRADAEAFQGAGLHSRTDLAHAHVLRPAEDPAWRRPGRAGAGVLRARGIPRGDIVAWLPRQRILFAGGPGGGSGCALHRGTRFHRDWASGTLDARRCASAPRALIGGRGAVAHGEDAVRAAITQTRDFLQTIAGPRSARSHESGGHAEGRVSPPRTRRSNHGTAAGRSSSTACRST